MVVVPAGHFTMGSPTQEEGRFDEEGPPHEVIISTPFAVGRFAITRGEFRAFVSETKHNTDGGCFAWNGQIGSTRLTSRGARQGFLRTTIIP